MKDERGSVLIVTMGFVVVFTMLGMASIHHAMSEHRAVAARKASMEAFWLADGAVQLAKAKLPAVRSIAEAATVLDTNRSFDYVSETSPGRVFEWKVQAYGLVNGERRSIIANISNSNFPDYPVTTSNPIPNLPFFLNPGEVKEKPNLSFNETFNIPEGTNIQESFCSPGHVFVNDIDPNGFDQITCLTFDTNDEGVEVPVPQNPNTILVIDVTGANQNHNATPFILFQGSVEGIVYIKGDTEIIIDDGIQIKGSVFLEGESKIIAGGLPEGFTGDIKFNGQAVDGAIARSRFGGFPTNPSSLAVKSWKEVEQLDDNI